VDAVRALANNSADLLETNFSSVIGFSRATRCEAGAHDGKYYGFEMGSIVVGEGTVYENVPSAHPDVRADRTLEIAASSCGTVKCVARPFGLRMRTPSEVVPSTFDVLRPPTLEAFRLTTFDVLATANSEVLRVTAFGAFVAPRETFEAKDLDDFVIDKLCARFQAKTRVSSLRAARRLAK
jgi:hypothetical protein